MFSKCCVQFFGIFTIWVAKNSKNRVVPDLKFHNHSPTDRNDNVTYINVLILNEQTEGRKT